MGKSKNDWNTVVNLDLSKASGPDCILGVVPKNCQPELSYILAELFNKCLKDSCFQIAGWFHWWSLKNVGERGLQLKTMALLVFVLWLVKF